MQVLIVEDEAPARKRLQTLLQQAEPSVQVLEMLDSVENTVQWLRHHHPPELMFLDIQLADGLSFDIFGQIQVSCPVIFTTAFHEFTLQAFKVNSIDYLLKPIKVEDLQAALRKFKDLRQQFQHQTYSAESIQQLLQSLAAPPAKEYKHRFLVKLGERLLSVQEQEIAYFRAEQKLVLLQTNDDRRYALDYSLEELERLLNPAIFFRLNRQIIAHINAIQVVHQHFNGKLKISLLPAVNEEVLVSKEKASEFKQWLDQ